MVTSTFAIASYLVEMLNENSDLDTLHSAGAWGWTAEGGLESEPLNNTNANRVRTILRKADPTRIYWTEVSNG